MKDEYYLINKKILPEYFDAVIKIREELQTSSNNISLLCEKYNVSRSTYYKYKDYVFRPMKNHTNKVIIGIFAFDERGVLSEILNIIAKANANILTLNQEMPIHDVAYITITIDALDLNIEIDELINRIRKSEKIKAVELIAFEG